MSRPQKGHKRFIAGVIYCPITRKQWSLGLEHKYADAYTCPGCSASIPAVKVTR